MGSDVKMSMGFFLIHLILRKVRNIGLVEDKIANFTQVIKQKMGLKSPLMDRSSLLGTGMRGGIILNINPPLFPSIAVDRSLRRFAP